MTEEELQGIIDQFDENNLKQQGVFGVWYSHGDTSESFIRANKEGLELFAFELLKSARDTNSILADSEKNIIHLDDNGDWIDENSNILIHYIEPIADRQNIKRESESQSTIGEKLLPVGCVLGLIILIISVAVGFVTMYKWIF